MKGLADILDLLGRPLDVEVKSGCRNHSVIGGLDEYMVRWARQGLEQAAGEQRAPLERIIALFEGYADADPAQRQSLIEEARQQVAAARCETPHDSGRSQPQPDSAPVPDVNNPRRSAARPLTLSDEVQYVRGVGPKRGQLLSRLGVRVVEDLLTHYPQRYEDRTVVRRLTECAIGGKESVRVTVLDEGVTEYKRKGFSITRVPASDESARCDLVWFNQPYMAQRFRPQSVLFVHGKVGLFRNVIQFENPEIEVLTTDDSLQVGRIVPIYPLTQGLYQSHLRRAVDDCLQRLPSLDETLPPCVLQRHQLIARDEAVRNIHFPASDAAREAARKRLAFEEFLLLQLALAMRQRRYHATDRGIAFHIDRERLTRFLNGLPFRLTRAQKRVCRQILDDMAAPAPMHRLLHGDVGSGKTVVAVLALLAATNEGYQGAVMAPTEVLAEQHHRVFREWLQPAGVVVELLTGSLTAAEQRRVRAAASEGGAHVLVGTHALIQESTEFSNLGLVIIDEQHRFGVLQRAALQQKGRQPDVLVMTATPIPRTLALTVYGDLDVSVIDEMPPGRRPVETRWVRTKRGREQAYRTVRQAAAMGRQSYVVCPLVEDSEKLEYIQAATSMAERLQNEIFPDLRVGLLHGRMTPGEKDEVMAAFRAGEIDVLTATTVIEVGIDVPNASVMLIEDASRFGLAQLHQLRGRVGRSTHPAVCLLLGRATTPEGRERLEAMVRTTDGFEIAEVDLALRGPGEFYGTRQHGLPDLKIADVLHDIDLLVAAREEANRLLDSHPDLNAPEVQVLRQRLSRFWDDAHEFVTVG